MARVGIDARTATNILGGIRTYSRGLIAGLERLESAHEFIVFRTRGQSTNLPTRFRQAELRTPTHHRFERYVVSAELLRHRLQILHSLDFIPPLRGARRHVITVHDLAFLRHPEILTPRGRRYYNEQIGFAVRHADHILAVSEATKADLLELLGVPPERVTVQVEGVDDVFHPLDDDLEARARARLKLPTHYLLFVGTLEPRKNIPRLLDAYTIARGRLERPPELLIVGRRGWLFDESLIATERAGVTWLGEAAADDLPALYSLATALVMPSYYEGFGLPALEAMACGTVPVVSHTSSLPEVVGDVGLLVDPNETESIAEAICRVATDDAWRAEQEREAVERARLFTWERCAETALGVYEALLR